MGFYSEDDFFDYLEAEWLVVTSPADAYLDIVSDNDNDSADADALIRLWTDAGPEDGGTQKGRFGYDQGNDLIELGYGNNSHFTIDSAGLCTVKVYITSPRGISGNEAFGNLALENIAAGAEFNTALGYEALKNLSTGDGNTGVGYGAGYTIETGAGNTFVGDAADGIATSTYATCIGQYTWAAHSNVCLLGRSAESTAANQIVFGSENAPHNDMFIGEGVLSATPPTTVSINGTGGIGSNAVGAGLQLAPGRSTGNVAPGPIKLAFTEKGVSGSTLNALEQCLHIRGETAPAAFEHSTGDATDAYFRAGDGANASNGDGADIVFQPGDGDGSGADGIFQVLASVNFYHAVRAVDLEIESGASTATLTLTSGANDAFIILDPVVGGNVWAIGEDFTDAGAFVIADSSTPGTNNRFKITPAGAVSIPGTLDVTGKTTLSGAFETDGLADETTIDDADEVLLDNSGDDTFRKMTRANLFKQPSFRAYRSGDQAGIVTNTWTKVNINAESHDTHGYFDHDATQASIVDYAFEPQAYPGYYKIIAQVYLGTMNDGTIAEAALYVNNVLHAVNWVYVSQAGGFAQPAVSTTVYLNAGDYVEVYCWHNNGVNETVYGGATATWFHATRVSA